MKKTLGALAVTAALVFGGAAGCATKINMDRSASMTAAEAKVKVKKKDDNRREIKVAVEHLTPIERVSADAKHYVVWLQPKENPAMPSNLGVLEVDDDQEGKLEASTAFEHFDLFITAEEDAQATSPRGERVLWATVD